MNIRRGKTGDHEAALPPSAGDDLVVGHCAVDRARLLVLDARLALGVELVQVKA